MNAHEAKVIAEAFIAQQPNNGFLFVFVSAEPGQMSDEWGVVFDILSPKGNIVDGPLVVLVHERTRDARFLG